MTLEELISAEIPHEKFAGCTKEELIILLKGEQSIRRQLQKRLDRVEAINEQLRQKTFLIEEQFVTVKNVLFGKSSEKSPKGADKETAQGGVQGAKEKKKRILLPSERYPNAPLIEQHVTLDVPPKCGCCSAEMTDSGMTEDAEFLTIIPEQYFVVRQLRHKYRCQKCHGDIKTAPLPPRIKAGCGYSDEMIVDVAMTKYCDLVPIERYANIAARGGLKDLPPQSLIEATHNLADFAKPAYDKLKNEILSAPVLHADETPHRMLEGDKKSSWFLWGFSTEAASYFECHDSRSGDVASNLLSDAVCGNLVSDVYSGYSKAVRVANEERQKEKKPLINHVFCNAHARRYFRQAGERNPDEARFYVDQYKEIYRLNDLAKEKPPDEVLRIRSQMRPHFTAIKDRALSELGAYSDKSKLGKAMRYFLKNERGFTRFLEDASLPIDNNSQERLLRNPVIGRKTWYGTHSKRGAETAAVLFSLVESCKLNKVNPRQYLKRLVQNLHQGKPAITPKEFASPLH